MCPRHTTRDGTPFTIPTGVRLTSYAGEAHDLPADALDRYLRAIEAGTLGPDAAGTPSFGPMTAITFTVTAP